MSAMRRIERTFVCYRCHCRRCGHVWLAFTVPKACAKCKSRSWNVKPGSVPLGRPKKGEQ